MQHIKTLFAALLVMSCTPGAGDYTGYVDTHIGTGGHGHVFVGANVPFGMVQLGPTSIPQSWDWCSGYHESDSTVIGFSHTHLSGTGIGDLFDITVMPVTGTGLRYDRGTEDDPESGLWSYADRTREISRPGYYSVPLLRYGITAEMTATNRVGMHRYTFPESEEAALVFDLVNGGCWDRPTDMGIEIIDSVSVRGWRHSRGWADNQKVFFHAVFSKPFVSSEVISDGDLPHFTRFNFHTSEGEQLMLKVSLSSVSTDGALANMNAELPGWNFDATAQLAEKEWNKELSRIRIETGDERTMKIFYTALCHTMIAPSTFCDIDGSYRGADGKIYKDPGHSTYTTFSLWDTYRAAMPLYSIFQSERYMEFVNTMLDICDRQGKLPVWHLMGCETNCMVGNPGIPPVADAIVKDLEGLDQEKAFEAIRISAMRPDRGQEHRMKYGYIPCDLMGESVAYDLEYALADGAAALAAGHLAQKFADDPEKSSYYMEQQAYFTERSKSYRHLFDKELRFIRGRDSKGEFRKKYSPFASVHRADDYCEGNGWQYTWLVPHDIEGLTECFSGREAFLEKLDSLFTVPSLVTGAETSPDISGLIGQYAHGNEPSHHILYLYAMAGEPHRTADRVREVLSDLYSDHCDGLSGNEDVGQMSAWYILSSLGFYEAEPGSGRYWFGSPVFDRAEIKVSGGTFTIVTKNNSAGNRYIQSMTLNGQEYDKPYICHSDIAEGGTLVIEMGNTTNDNIL